MEMIIRSKRSSTLEFWMLVSAFVTGECNTDVRQLRCTCAIAKVISMSDTKDTIQNAQIEIEGNNGCLLNAFTQVIL